MIENNQMDLFGEPINKTPTIADVFIENPFSILDAKTNRWQKRKRMWKQIGIDGTQGRNVAANQLKKYISNVDYMKRETKSLPNETSCFDPVLTELMYTWFCPKGGYIIDPFAGGSERGIVAQYLGYHYTGIDIRKEQVEANEIQAQQILEKNNTPQWIVGDSNEILNNIENETFDMAFTCPPYHNLEKYSQLDGDLSNMTYNDFINAYEQIIKKTCDKLKKGAHAVFVVGEFRVRKNYCRGFVNDTYNAFQKCGMKLFNEMILATPLGMAGFVAKSYMKNKKIVKVHQNILDFVKI